MRNKHPILLTGVTLFPCRLTAQDIYVPENIKEVEGDFPIGSLVQLKGFQS